MDKILEYMRHHFPHFEYDTAVGDKIFVKSTKYARGLILFSIERGDYDHWYVYEYEDPHPFKVVRRENGTRATILTNTGKIGYFEWHILMNAHRRENNDYEINIVDSFGGW